MLLYKQLDATFTKRARLTHLAQPPTHTHPLITRRLTHLLTFSLAHCLTLIHSCSRAPLGRAHVRVVIVVVVLAPRMNNYCDVRTDGLMDGRADTLCRRLTTA